MTSKVLLVNLPSRRVRFNFSGRYPVMPLGLAYIADALRHRGHAAEILDLACMAWDEDRVRRRLRRGRYAFVGLSVTLFNFVEASSFARIVKLVCPETLVVVGGPGTASFPPALVFERIPDFDVLVLGEGERTMVELADEAGRGQPLGGLAGTAVHTERGVVEIGPDRPFLNLDELPIVDRDRFSTRRYSMHPPFGIHGAVSLVETARGCGRGCSFCGMPSTLRERSVCKVLDELTRLSLRSGAREVHFVDPTFVQGRERILELCEGIRARGIDIKWSCKTRVDTVDPEVLDAMALAGCYMISYGLESGSDEILSNLAKETTVAQNEAAIRWSRERRIRTLAYVMLGNPGETDRTVEQTVDMVVRARPDFALFAELLPDPGASATIQAYERGEFTEEAVASFYLDGTPGPLAQRSFTGVERSTLDRWLKNAYCAFYLRPRYAVQRLTSLRGGGELQVMLRGVLSLLAERATLGPTTDGCGEA